MLTPEKWIQKSFSHVTLTYSYFCVAYCSTLVIACHSFTVDFTEMVADLAKPKSSNNDSPRYKVIHVYRCVGREERENFHGISTKFPQNFHGISTESRILARHKRWCENWPFKRAEIQAKISSLDDYCRPLGTHAFKCWREIRLD